MLRLTAITMLPPRWLSNRRGIEMKEYLKPEMRMISFVQKSGIAADIIEDGLYDDELELSSPIEWWPEGL